MAKRKRKTSGRSTASRRKNRTQDRMPAGLITLFAGLVLMALAFVPGSSAWRTMHDVLFGVFGCGSFVLGAALCYLAILYTRGEDLLPHIAKLVLGLIFASGTVIVFSDIPTDQTAAQMTAACYHNGMSAWLSGGALGAVVLLTGMSADNPLVNIITGEPLKSGQGGVIGVVAAVWVLAKIRKFISKRMPEALDLVLSSFIALTLTGLITLFFIMPVAGLISDGILIFVTKLLEIGGVVTGFVLASIWLPIVMFGLHHFMTPIHIELINQTGMTVLLPILAQAGAGQVGAALAIWLKCRKNKPLVGIVKGGLPSGILGIGEPLIYGVTLPLGKPFLTACLGAGVGGAFIASFGNGGATSQAVSGILVYLRRRPAALLCGRFCAHLLFRRTEGSRTTCRNSGRVGNAVIPQEGALLWQHLV